MRKTLCIGAYFPSHKEAWDWGWDHLPNVDEFFVLQRVGKSWRVIIY